MWGQSRRALSVEIGAIWPFTWIVVGESGSGKTTETLAGEVQAAGEEALQAAPLSATHVRTLDRDDRINEDNRRELLFIAELWGQDGREALQAAFFAPTKHLQGIYHD